MNNKKRGNAFEEYVCKFFANKGFWVRPLYAGDNGSQPFDILAMKNQGGVRVTYAVDCKTLKGTKFPLSRIEYNQEIGFQFFRQKCGDEHTYYKFFILVNGEKIYALDALYLINLKKAGVRSIDVIEEGVHCGNISK